MKRVALKHGGGGRAMRQLISEVLVRGAADFHVDGVGVSAGDDGAAVRVGDDFLLFTTDSHVVLPLIFPGGDIGRLAVSGTVNDLTMMGATRLLGFSSAVVMEEGFSVELLNHIHESLWATCREVGVPILTGDTKVMGKGELDGLIINTSGIALTSRVIRDNSLRVGDSLIVTGTVGDHGLAVMAARHRLELEGELRSDVAPLFDLMQQAFAAGGEAIGALKDPTRGGLASALTEMATKSQVGILLHESSIPVSDAARAASELLGIDVLQVANEGKALIGVRPGAANAVLAALKAHPRGRHAALIGEVVAEPVGKVLLDTGFGQRWLHESDGELLPRIC